MRNEQKRRNLKIILVVVGLIVAVLIIAFTGIEIIKRSKISNFEVTVSNLTCTDKDQISQYLKNSDLQYFSFKQDEFGNNLKKKFFCIGKIETSLSYPDKFSLKVWGREALFLAKEVNTSLELNPVVNLPVVFEEATQSTKEAVAFKILNQILSDIKQSSESGVFLVDKEGIIFEQNPESVNLPLLSIMGIKMEIGRQIPDGIVEKVDQIYNKLKEIEAPIGNIIIIGDRLVIDSKPRIVFSLKKRLDFQTASLQLILAQAKIDSDIESIDLRFDKPVVVYAPK